MPMDEDHRFAFDMRLDDRGVIRATFSGVFDLRQWADLQREALAREFPNGRDLTLPIVADLRAFRPPAANWTLVTKGLFAHQNAMGPARGRCALIIGDNMGAKIGAKFYTLLKSTMHRTGAETRSFVDYDEGYAWAVTGVDPAASG